MGSFFFKDTLLERITGLDLLPNLVTVCAKNDFSIFLLGASPVVGEKLKEVILTNYQHASVVGVYVPPFMTTFTEEENNKMINAVNVASPEVLLVSLTAPKQDLWIANNKDALNATLLVGIGGAFEVMAGLAKRAPKWAQKAGFRMVVQIYSRTQAFV